MLRKRVSKRFSYSPPQVLLASESLTILHNKKPLLYLLLLALKFSPLIPRYSFVRCYMVVSNDVVYWNKLLVFVGFVKLGSFICQTQCGVSKFGWGYFAKGKKFASLFPNSQNNNRMGINSSLALFLKKKSYSSCMNNSQGRVNTQQVFGLSNSDLVPGKYEGGYFLFCSLHFCLFIRSEFGKPFSRIRKHQNWVLESKLSLGAFELTIFQTHSFILILLMSNQLQIWFPLS